MNLSKKKKLIIRKGVDSIEKSRMASITITNHIIEVKTVKKQSNNLSNYRKIDRDHSVNLETGELIDHHQDSVSTGRTNLKAAFDRLRQTINLNFQGKSTELHVVLTYGEKMEEPTRLTVDYKRFWDKFRYRYPGSEYIVISEPQQSGSWHLHVLLKNDAYPDWYIPVEGLRSLWSHGFVWISKLTGNDNIGAYFTKRFKDIDAFENDQMQSDKKLIVENARLQFYPPYFKLFRCSKGILKPTRKRVPYSQVKRMVGSHTPVFSKTVEILETLEEKEIQINEITEEHYNFKRKRSKQNEF